ncbi:PaaI family thioesterase [Kordia algicida OT-1]|uniref:Delta-aminolevulinic acid dehydratase n=1 Tax=Kordia algicida OT-1 TaxID=391587 RepID=A9DTF2_9FLAO|nr:PaaI family thioesterase [Kordia algicida]EDP97065.1 delta-aminolevulinic acid dehydratase [Kordia algicida OT-1]
MEHYQKLVRMYLTSNMNTQLYESTEMMVEDEKAIIKMTIDPKYFHALGAIHGSVYFKLLDDAAFFAVNSIVKDAFVLTTSFNINIIRPVSKGVITATGTLKFKSRNLFVAESILVDEKGREIAFGTGNFAKSKIPLTEEIGYK